MQLAQTPAGRRQLVTTNFDRLFSDCDQSVTEYLAPRLPRLTPYDMLDGVVYLHGKLNAQYNDAEGHGLVLSSSDFGKAYLSDGWATEFFRRLTSKFTIVFIGYSGDDPPIRYLLEGFSRDEVRTGSLYAFQRNESGESLAKWQHKNVKPIPFESFDELWSSLSLWAKRADHQTNWRKEVVALAGQSPKSLKPYQRDKLFIWSQPSTVQENSSRRNRTANGYVYSIRTLDSVCVQIATKGIMILRPCKRHLNNIASTATHFRKSPGRSKQILMRAKSDQLSLTH